MALEILFFSTIAQIHLHLGHRSPPIVKHVWGGTPLPFPILLDNTFQTWERFGLPGLGTVLLIDPHGNLVNGDR